ncbi:MAG: hypothetical protein BGO31_01350 [Bacteroidetes bacterium 43-16]|nr:MAG: hypothetical protein BGO31_01350 [Bacteroidetes bacterium 43-16]
MKSNLDIQKEWESIGAGFSTQIGLPLFRVPEDYFERLPNEIISGIRAISAAEPELAQIDSPFLVPDNYFQQLDQNLLLAVKDARQVIDHTTIKGLSKENVFKTPEGYFDQFPDTVWALLQQEEPVEEELEESPLLASLKGINPFEQPETTEIAVPKIQSSPKAKPEIEVPMTVRKSLRWSNWAAAASVALFFVLGAGWLITDNRNNGNNMAQSTMSKPDMVSKKLAALPDAAIEAYLDQNIDEFSEYMLEDNVSSATINTQYSAENALNNISDAELEAYLNNDLY